MVAWSGVGGSLTQGGVLSAAPRAGVYLCGCPAPWLSGPFPLDVQ